MKIIEYTVNTGNRDSKIRAPYPGNHKKVCIHDDSDEVDPNWKQVDLQGTIGQMDIQLPDEHPAWLAFAIRCMPHLVMPKAGWWIYHDANVVLRKSGEGNPQKLIENMGDAEIGMRMPPEERKPNLEAELEESAGMAVERCNYHNYDAEGQAEHYRKYPRISHKSKRTWAAGIILRKNTERVREFNERWWQEICRWRDIRTQASLSAVLQEMKLNDEVCEIPREAIVVKGHK